MSAPRPQPLSQPKRAIDDVIADALEQAQASGELASAKLWGKPPDLGDGYDDTPAELRLPMKILRDAGVQPYEVALMHQIAELGAKVDVAEAWADEACARPPSAVFRTEQRLWSRGFARVARRKPERYVVVSRGFATPPRG